MNIALLFPDAHENPKLESVGSAAAWYWACGLMFCRRRQEARVARGEPIDFIPNQHVLTLFADPKARDHVKALVKAKLWHETEGGYVVNDYQETYRELDSMLAGPADTSQHPAELQPNTEDPPQPTPSQLGGMARSLASRTPAGQFQPTPASIQPNSSQRDLLVSPTPPSDPEDPQKQITERYSEPDESKGSPGARGAGRKRATALPPDFRLTEEHMAFGATKSWPEWWMRNRCEQFCDLAAAKGWTYKDWKLALYTFLRNEITYGRGPAAMARFGPSGSTKSGSGFSPRGPVQNNHGMTGLEALQERRK